MRPINADSEDTPHATKTLVIGGYMVCSALMLMVNKLTIHHLPAPGVVLFVQFISSAIFAKTTGTMGICEVDSLTNGKIQRFVPAACAQLATIFSGMKALQYSNVETFIVFRASTPLLLCVIDHACLGRELPSRRSTLCLAGLLFGTILYTITDSAFLVHGYKWIVIWYAAFAFDQAYLKHVIETVDMTPMGAVYYQNTIASLFTFLIIGLCGELSQLHNICLKATPSASPQPPAFLSPPPLRRYGPLSLSAALSG